MGGEGEQGKVGTHSILNLLAELARPRRENQRVRSEACPEGMAGPGD